MFTRLITIGLSLFLLCGTPWPLAAANEEKVVLSLGLSPADYRGGLIPEGWTLRRRLYGPSRRGEARWVMEDGRPAVMLHSNAALTFIERSVAIDLKEYPLVAWSWKAENLLEGVDERTVVGDDHPIRIFFVLAPDETRQSFWFRTKRLLYLDRFHGHAMGGRFTEYLWSSHLNAGETIADPGKPWQKLMVVEGGSENLGRWVRYRRNLYQDFKTLYDEEPRRLIFIGILCDTDATGQEARSYIRDLRFLPAASSE